MKKIAVTGTLGAGKSTVCKIFAEQGAYVVNADDIAHRLLEEECRPKVIQLLGLEIVVDGKINRQRVAKLVFKNPQKLKQLEAILHPAILKQLKLSMSQKPHKLFVAEIPLLFELGWNTYFDQTLCVTRASYQFTEEDALRTSYQLSPEEKAKRADFVINNDGGINELKKKTLNLIAKIGA